MRPLTRAERARIWFEHGLFAMAVVVLAAFPIGAAVGYFAAAVIFGQSIGAVIVGAVVGLVAAVGVLSLVRGDVRTEMERAERQPRR